MSANLSATAGRARDSRMFSTPTLVIAAALVALTALCTYGYTQMYSDTVSDAAYATWYWFGTGLQVLLAVILVGVALRIGVRESVGRQWLLVGLGVVMYAIGDIVWTVLDLHLGIDPYPSIADIFYTLEYAFFLAGLAFAIYSYRALVTLRGPLIGGAIVSVAAAGVLYAVLLGPFILPAGVEELGFWGFIVSTLYPVGDVFFMIAPAVTLALVIRQLGAGRLAWPWWIVVVGAFVFAIADSLYSYVDWSGVGSNPFIDMGWIVANLLFVIAALVARDVYHTR